MVFLLSNTTLRYFLFWTFFECRFDRYNTDVKDKMKANLAVDEIQGAYDSSASAYK